MINKNCMRIVFDSERLHLLRAEVVGCFFKYLNLPMDVIVFGYVDNSYERIELGTISDVGMQIRIASIDDARCELLVTSNEELYCFVRLLRKHTGAWIDALDEFTLSHRA